MEDGGRVVVAHEGEDLKRGHIKSATHVYKNVILPLKITKMSFYHSELQKCRYVTQNYKNATLG